MARRGADEPQASEARRGPAAFEAFYRAQFGPRWDALRECLLAAPARGPRPRFARANAFAAPSVSAELAADTPPAAALALGLPQGCFELPADAEAPPRVGGLCSYYVMDPSSVLVARQVPAAAQRVLDLCAAPGGKSLVVAEHLPEATLHLNDRSPKRAARLRQVLSDYLPERERQRVHVTVQDGVRCARRRAAQYDAVLLDAPCSSERHVLNDANALAKWSRSRIERLSRDQYALVTAALGALVPGGTLVYATCALAEAENDGVLTRLLERGRHPVRVDRLDLGVGERTALGWRILPDDTGFGPAYVARLRKLD